MSSSLFPLNMLPVMTSIHPTWGLRRTSSMELRAALVLAGLGVDPNQVAGVDERRHRDHEAGFDGGGLDLRARRRALDPGRRVEHLEIDRRGELDADRRAVVELHLDRRFGQEI